MKVRIFREPSGNLRILHLAPKHRLPDELDDAFIARVGTQVTTRDSSLAGLPFIDVEEASLHALDRSLRHKWRTVGQAVVVDPTVPNLPHPKQALLDEIDAATTMDALKAAVKKVIR